MSDAVHVIRMPDLGEGNAEVELVAWRVQPGDAVAEDQVLADVMTDKATVEIPSPVAGRVIALGGEVGQLMAVGSELIRIGLAGEAVAAGLIETDEAAAAGLEAPTPSAAPAPVSAPAEPAPPAPSPSPATAPAPARPAAPASPAALRPIASPAVRARAWELGIALEDLIASGPGGRIVHADLDAHLARTGGRPASAEATAPPSAAAPVAPAAADVVQRIKVVGLRRKIAQKMQLSKRSIPHFSYVEEVDVSEVEALRARLNARWGESRGHLTLLPFLIRALVLAVEEFPQVNARFDDEAGEITQHSAVHLGVATQTAAGLMVPVLRNAQAKDLWANAAEVQRLSQAARNGKVVRDELSGSTITLTSLGKLGGIMSTPIINHPEVAIVGVNRIALRPVIHGGAVVARSMMNLSSSFDHRVVDGSDAAAFVQSLRGYLEHPATLFID